MRRLRAEDGFGMIELMMAVVMLNVGILAIVAAFTSGGVALRRSSAVANATTIADKQLEAYRGFRNCQIYLDRNATGGIPTTGTYATDTAYNATQMTDATTGTGISPIPATCSFGTYSGLSTTLKQALTAHQTITGPDNRGYVVDTYIIAVSIATGGYAKQVTVVVRDPSNTTGTLVRQSSAFDPSNAP